MTNETLISCDLPDTWTSLSDPKRSTVSILNFFYEVLFTLSLILTFIFTFYVNRSRLSATKANRCWRWRSAAKPHTEEVEVERCSDRQPTFPSLKHDCNHDLRFRHINLKSKQWQIRKRSWASFWKAKTRNWFLGVRVLISHQFIDTFSLFSVFSRPF